MIIRGIDFARHNVIVGNDAESLAPGGAGQAILAPREIVMARVVEVAGGEATLDMGGQRMVVETHVALNAGDKLFVRIQEPKNGTVRLSIVQSGPDGEDGLPTLADSDLEAVMRDLDLPTDDRTRQAARALIARDGTLVKDDLKNLLQNLKQFEHLTTREAGAAALLQKSGIPITQTAVAIVLQRAMPEAGPQLAERLQPLKPALERAAKQFPQLASTIKDVLATLSGLPLDEQASTPRVAEALKNWIQKLSPEFGPGTTNSGALPELELPGAPMLANASALTGEPPLADSDALAENESDQASHGAVANSKTGASKASPQSATPEKNNDITGSKTAAAQSSSVFRSQSNLTRLGINEGGQRLGAPELASQLEKIAKEVGPEQKQLVHLLREAVAELRYTQLANSPAPNPTAEQTYLIPLLLPQQSNTPLDGRIQVFHKSGRPGEPVDPNNVRLVFVLDTEHLQTVQADLTIKDGVIDLQMGVFDEEDRKLLADHLNELENAITQMGWDTGRFSTQRAKRLPPPIRQEEGLTEVVRFDRRI